jgi:hypothetical protein
MNTNHIVTFQSKLNYLVDVGTIWLHMLKLVSLPLKTQAETITCRIQECCNQKGMQ